MTALPVTGFRSQRPGWYPGRTTQAVDVEQGTGPATA